MKTWKKVLALVLALAMVIPGVYLGGSKAQEAKAETGEEESTVTAKDHVEGWSKEDAAKLIGTKTAPIVREKEDKANWLFAGWFSTDKCTLDGGITKAPSSEEEGTVYAKFVPVGILDVKAQSTAGDSGENIIRFVSSVDTLNYSKVGFEVTYKVKAESDGDGSTYRNVKRTNISNTVYRKIDSENENIKYEFDPKVVDIESDYFITATLDITLDLFKNDGVTTGTDFTVKAFWETLDGTRVRGTGRCVSIADSRSNNTVNLSFAANGIEKGVTTLSATSSADGLAITQVDIIAVDDTTNPATVYVRVTVDSKDKLPSATTFTFKEGIESESVVGSAIYRNLYTDYSKNGADMTWYTEYEKAGATEFTIATNADLYGFKEIVNAEKEDERESFSKKTVYLVADITANKDTPETYDEWTDYLASNEGALTKWTAIGTSSNAFAGTFDGQGHTISGIYLKSTESEQGLFGHTSKCTIKNFRIENSYFENGEGSACGVGSVAGYFGGTLESVYSNATVVNHRSSAADYGRAGGFIGATDEVTTITNCWFDGEVNTTSGKIAGFVGNSQAALTVKQCLNTSKITSTYAPSHAGGIVGYAQGDLTVEDFLNQVDMSTGNANQSGTVFGFTTVVQSKNSMTDVYTTTDQITNRATGAKYSALCRNSGGSTNVYTGTIDVVGETRLAGGLALANAPGLDYDDYWTIVVKPENDIPILQTFADIIPDIEAFVPADTAWYDENPDAKSFTINTLAELYGFAQVAVEDNFEGQTIYLGGDIVVNKNTPKTLSEWETYIEENAPANWVAIGSNAGTNTPFKGTFDGNGNTISGIYLDNAFSNQGLFGTLGAGSTVQNLRIENSYFRNGGSGIADVGSVSGYGGGNLINIYSNAVIRNNRVGSEFAGRSGGFIGYQSEVTKITGCWFDGEINSTTGTIGGFVAETIAQTTIEHCLNTGVIKTTYSGSSVQTGGIGGYLGSKVTVNDCLIQPSVTVGANDGTIGTVFGFLRTNNATYKGSLIVSNLYVTTKTVALTSGSTFERFGSLSSTYSGDIALIPESYLTGDKAYTLTTLDFEDSWAAIKDGTPIPRYFADDDAITDFSGILRADTDWYGGSKDYTIRTAAELYGLVQLSFTKNFAGETIRLGNDITVNEGTPATLDEWTLYLKNHTLTEWGSIGSSEVQFAGTFDGNGNAIRGIYLNTSLSYQGLFGYANGCTVQNLRLENSYFESSATTLGSVLGYGGGEFASIYSNAVVVGTRSGDYGRIAGMIGMVEGKTTITGTWFDGEVVTYSSMGAGYIGQVYGDTTIKDCLNTGKILTYWVDVLKTGGIAGYVVAPLTIENCLNQVEITTSRPYQQCGTVFGYAHPTLAPSSKVVMKNVYTTTDEIKVTLDDSTIKGYCQGGESAYTVAEDGIVLVTVDELKESAETKAPRLYGESGLWTKASNGLPTLRTFLDITRQ